MWAYAVCIILDGDDIYWVVDTAWAGQDGPSPVSGDVYFWRPGLNKPKRLFSRPNSWVRFLHVSDGRLVWLDESARRSSWSTARLGTHAVRTLPIDSELDVVLGRRFIAWVDRGGSVFAAEFSGTGDMPGRPIALSRMPGGRAADAEGRLEALATDGKRVAWVAGDVICTWTPGARAVSRFGLGTHRPVDMFVLDGKRLAWTVGSLEERGSEDQGVFTTQLGQSSVTTLAGPLTGTSVVDLSILGDRTAWVQESVRDITSDQEGSAEVFTSSIGGGKAVRIGSTEAGHRSSVLVRAFGIVHGDKNISVIRPQ